MVFSIELDDPAVRRALDLRLAAAGRPDGDELEAVKSGAAAALGEAAAGAIRLSIDKRTRRLRLAFPASPTKGARPQDVIAAVFGLEYPAFYLTRERFLFAPAGQPAKPAPAAGSGRPG
jgi:hypothetical protein